MLSKWNKEDWFIAGIMCGIFLYAFMHVMSQI